MPWRPAGATGTSWQTPHAHAKSEWRGASAAGRQTRSASASSADAAVAEVGDVAADVEALALEAGDRALGPALDADRPRGSARRRARRASGRRSRPSRWPAATRRPARGARRRARRWPASPDGACGAWSCATGRGRRSRARRGWPGAIRFSSVQTASTEQNRTLSAPASATRHSESAMPGSHTSRARTLWSGRAAARTAVASPMPDPISRISGASRPKRSASEKSAPVDRLLRDHPVRLVRGPRLGLARGEPAAAARVGEDLAHPAPVLGELVVRAGRAYVVHALILARRHRADATHISGPTGARARPSARSAAAARCRRTRSAR